MDIKGQVTISLKEFEKLKAAAEKKEYAENKLEAFGNNASQLYEIEDTEFWKKVKKIDEKPMTDKQFDEAMSEARKALKIIVDITALKKTIRTLINRMDYPFYDTHIELKNASDEELEAIEICFREQKE